MDIPMFMKVRGFLATMSSFYIVVWVDVSLAQIVNVPGYNLFGLLPGFVVFFGNPFDNQRFSTRPVNLVFKFFL